MMHNIDPYLINPYHKVTVTVIGCGGTGSRVLHELTKVNYALTGLGHPGLFINAWDDDKVDSVNLVRQMFYAQDINKYKSDVLIERLNRSYGLNWKSTPKRFGSNRSLQSMHDKYLTHTNIYFSCVDSWESRFELLSFITRMKSKPHVQNKAERPMYWFDCGNGLDYCQVIMGTIMVLDSNMEKQLRLKNICEVFPDQKDEFTNEPSCSIAMSLGRQELFINGYTTILAVDMFWQLMRNAMIDYNAVFYNSDKSMSKKLYKR